MQKSRQSFHTVWEFGNEKKGREVPTDWGGLFAHFVFLRPPTASIQRAVIFLCHALPVCFYFDHKL
jgi:hypothetical protein